jgi:hypothetical protein
VVEPVTPATGGQTKRILLRSPKDPFEVVSPETVLERNLIASNSGNLVFIHAANKILATTSTEITPDGLRVDPGDAGRINERYDAYVIPLANAFRLSFEPALIRMTQLIERLTIPVVILGVGAQSNLKYELDRLRPIEPTVRAFVSAVLDHAPSIGVRGELTQAYLQGLGFRDVEVIGCPSMFLWGENLRVEKRAERLGPDARVALNVSPYVKAMGDIVMSHAERYPNLAYIAQDLDTLNLLLWGESAKAAAQADAIPIHTSHPLFRENRVRFYVEPWPWIADLRTCDFAFGTRIHGNIAAILAGTPAYVFAHDSRTLELVRYFDIPHRPMPLVPPDVDAADLYDEADYGELNRGHAARFATFLDYLRRHRLGHVFEDGEDGSAFDARVARTSYPPAIDASSAIAPPDSLAARIRRARHGLRRAARSPSVRRLRVSALRRRADINGRPVPGADDIANQEERG